MIHVAAKQMDARSQPIQIPISIVPAKGVRTGASGQGVRTHPQMILLAMEREINQLVFYQVQQAYLPLCVKVHIYSTRSFVSLFNGKEIFWIVMMSLGGGRAIITLRAADRDRGRRRGCQRSWEVTFRHFIPVLSLCRWRNVGHDKLL